MKTWELTYLGVTACMGVAGILCFVAAAMLRSKFFKRLFCMHLNWIKSMHPRGIIPNFGYEWWTCDKCGKVIECKRNDPPIQWVIK